MKSSEQLKITHIPLVDIQASIFNPRKHFDEASIIELADSIKAKGVLQPILVRPIMGTNTRYEIIAGERRFRACKHLQLTDLHSFMTIPAIIRDLDDEAALEIMIIENLQRKDIHPMEEAAGFMNLSRIKSMDVKEIGARVGKSASYVAQRMKLCDLIEPIQKTFYEGRILVKDAMTLSTLKPEDQKDLFEEEMAHLDADEMYHLGTWDLRKYQHALMSAPFDIKDPHLKKDAGACTVCPHNTAFNTLLFPDMEQNPICQNSQCFKQKCNLSFDRELINAQEDPGVVLITGQYSHTADKDTMKIMKSVEGVLVSSQYVEISTPEYPVREDYDGNNETPEEDEDEFIQDLSTYRDEMQKLDSKISTGGYLKAFNIGGHKKGTYTWIKPTKAAKATAVKSSEAAANGSESAAEIKFEIDRIKQREKRAIELDNVKIWAEIYKLFDPEAVCRNSTDNNLSTIEVNAIAHALENKLSYTRRDLFRETFGFTEPPKKSKRSEDHTDYSGARVVDMLRFFMLDTLPPAAIYSSIHGDSAIMMLVAQQYYPDSVESICTTQADKATKRATSVEKRIKALQDKIKSLKKEVKKNIPKESPIKEPAASIIKKGGATKKGKGIKALIPQND